MCVCVLIYMRNFFSFCKCTTFLKFIIKCAPGANYRWDMLTDKNCSLIGPIYNLRICPKFKVKPQIFRNVAILVGNDTLAIIMLMKIANTFSCLLLKKVGPQHTNGWFVFSLIIMMKKLDWCDGYFVF